MDDSFQPFLDAHFEEPPRKRNGHTADRLKQKLGTRELATAEVTFDGALADPVGPADRALREIGEDPLG